MCMYLGFGRKTVYFRDVGLFVVFGVGHLTIEIIPIDEFENVCEDRCAAAGHLFYVISVPKNESLQVKRTIKQRRVGRLW